MVHVSVLSSGFEDTHCGLCRHLLCACSPPRTCAPQRPPADRNKLEQQILDIVSSAKGRAKLSEAQLDELTITVDALESMGGTAAPTMDKLLDGRWKLLFTSSPGTNSPIQRTFTGVESFSIFQEVGCCAGAAGLT